MNMNQFVLAFPIPVAVDEVFAVTENVKIAADTKTVMIPGCSVMFNVVRQPASSEVLDLFKENCELTDDEEKSIAAHKSLLFLLGNVKSMNDVEMVNTAILKMFTAGASGVYMQHSGAVWTADGFRESLGDGEFPMDTWFNLINLEDETEKSLYSVGLATFALPDLCFSTKADSSTAALDPEGVISMVAHSLFDGEVPAKSGSVLDFGDGGKYTLRQELKGLFSKTSPDYNKQGLLRIVKK
jgi:hypothetical protein